MEEGEGHYHSAFQGGRIGEGVDSFGGREVENVDLFWCQFCWTWKD